jgi:type IV pilus assembly protein PilM
VIKLARKVLCLDWDRRAVRMVVARNAGGRLVLEDAHSHRLPVTVDPENPEALGQFIQQLLRRHQWRFKQVVVDMPRDRAVINRLALPPTPEHELAAAVRFQAMKELPFPLEEAAVDFVVRQRNESGLAVEVLLAAVTQDTLATIQAVCTAAGLVPARIGLRPYANLTSVGHLEGLADKRVLMVDVGPAMTEIDVIDSGTLAFARSANVNVPLPADAASEDSRAGTLADVADLEASDTAVETAVNELTVEITRTLQAYRATEPLAEIEHVIVGGGTGVEAALRAALHQRFGFETTLFDPTAALNVPADDATKLRSFSAALGLAWSLTETGELALDFLNPKKSIPQGQILRRRLRIGGLAVAAVLTVAIGIDVGLYLRRHQELDAQREIAAALRKELREFLRVENNVEEVEDWRYQPVWPVHLLGLTEAAVEPGREMIVQQITMDRNRASISIKKLMATRWDVSPQFAGQLNEAKGPDGASVYRAQQGTYRTLTVDDPNFQGVTDVEIELKDLKKHLDESEERKLARRRKLRGL